MDCEVDPTPTKTKMTARTRPLHIADIFAECADEQARRLTSSAESILQIAGNKKFYETLQAACEAAKSLAKGMHLLHDQLTPFTTTHRTHRAPGASSQPELGPQLEPIMLKALQGCMYLADRFAAIQSRLENRHRIARFTRRLYIVAGVARGKFTNLRTEAHGTHLVLSACLSLIKITKLVVRDHRDEVVRQTEILVRRLISLRLHLDVDFADGSKGRGYRVFFSNLLGAVQIHLGATLSLGNGFPDPIINRDSFLSVIWRTSHPRAALVRAAVQTWMHTSPPNRRFQLSIWEILDDEPLPPYVSGLPSYEELFGATAEVSGNVRQEA